MWWPDAATRAALAGAAGRVAIRDGRTIAATNLHLTLLIPGEVAAHVVPALRVACGAAGARDDRVARWPFALVNGDESVAATVQ